MTVFLITYDLNVPTQDYAGLYEVLEAFDNWWHYLDSTWLICSTSSIDEVDEKVRSAMDSSDSLLIIDVTGRRVRGWLEQDAWDWIEEEGLQR